MNSPPDQSRSNYGDLDENCVLDTRDTIMSKYKQRNVQSCARPTAGAKADPAPAPESVDKMYAVLASESPDAYNFECKKLGEWIKDNPREWIQVLESLPTFEGVKAKLISAQDGVKPHCSAYANPAGTRLGVD